MAQAVEIHRMLFALPALSFGLLLTAAASLPAMRHLGYPMAVIATAPAVLCGLWASAYGWRSVASLAGVLTLFGLVTEPLWGCDWLRGVQWALMGPLLGAGLGFAVGRWLRQCLGLRRWWFIGACALLVLLDLLALAWRLYDQPQVMVFDWLLGYVHGPIYDEWVPIEDNLVRFRAALVAVTAAFLWRSATQAQSSRLADLALVITLISALPGHYMPDRSDLERQLNQSLNVPGLVVRFDEHPKSRRAAQRILKEGHAHLAHLTPLTLNQEQPPTPITVWLYRNAETKRRLMGAAHVLIARPWQHEVHLHPTRSPDPHLRHELVHALLAHRTRNFLGVPLTPLPNPSLVEGLAVYLAPGEQRLSLHQAAAALKRRGQLPTPNQLMSLRFTLGHGRRAYRAAGSLAQFIAEKYGLERLLEAYEAGSLSAARFNVPSLTKNWLKHLDATPDPPQARRNVLRLYTGQAVLERPCANEVQAAWRYAQRPQGKRSTQEIEADYRAVMALQGNCRALASLADRYHQHNLPAEQSRIEEEMIQRGLPSTVAARIFERRGDKAVAENRPDEALKHYRRALGAAPAEHRYRGLLVRMLLASSEPLLHDVAPYITTGHKRRAVAQTLARHYATLPPPAAAAAAYLLMRLHGNQGALDDAELWGQRAAPLPRTLKLETQRYLAELAERHKRPCRAQRRWLALARDLPAVGDRLDEHLARLRHGFPAMDCVVLARPKAP